MTLKPSHNGLYQKPKLVTVFGGSGFLGRYVVEKLTKRGYRVRVAVRRPARAYYMLQVGDVGQTQMLPTNVRIRQSVAHALMDADAAIFLPGLLYENGKNRFDAVHHEGAKNVAELSAAASIPLVHVSALTGEAPDTLAYVASKRAGEAAVLQAQPQAIIVRPSVIFGREDRFFNKFADMARFSPFLPLFGGGHNKMQPVYVGDVAEMIARGIDGDVMQGQIYELGGPQVMSMREALEEMLRVIGRKKGLVSLPFSLSVLLGGVAGLLGKLPLMPTMATSDQIKMLQYDSIVSETAKAEGRTLEGVGISPRTVEAILDSYLWRFRVQGQFAKTATQKTAQ